MTLSARGRRRKGHDWERKVAAMLRDLFDIDTHRGQQSRRGQDEADVVGVDGWHIECKAQEALNVWAAIEQAKRDAKPGARPVVIARRNNVDPIAVVPLSVWLECVAAVDRMQKATTAKESETP